MNKFWNYRLIGLFGLIHFFISASLDKLKDNITTVVLSNNLAIKSQNIFIQNGCTFRYPKNIVLMNYTKIGRNVSLTTELNTSKLLISENTNINKDCHIDFTGDLSIGRNCTISEEVMIQTHSHGFDPRSKPIKCPLTIEANVWIGARATILHNVSLRSENSIIAACSVVTKDVPKNVVVAGNPAKIIKELK